MAQIVLREKGQKLPKKPKRSEQEARTAFTFFDPDTKVIKFADTRRCRTCGSIIPKADEEPDFLVAKDWAYLEVKESIDGYFYPDGTGGFTTIQRKRLAEHESYVFLIMTDEEGRSAYLITYQAMLELENRLIETGTKGFRRKATRDLMGLDDQIDDICYCTWTPGQDGTPGVWELPRIPARMAVWQQLKSSDNLIIP